MKRQIVRRPLSTITGLEHLHPVLQRVYMARGIHTPLELDHTLVHLLHYQGLLGIEQATEQLAVAVTQQQKIVVVGDFDADGATSSALALSALRSFGARHVTYLVPNRFEYGYGLTPEIVAVALKRQPDVIMTVDNGISSHAGVTAAKTAGIRVIITDHHLPPSTLPPADAIVNPQQVGDTFLSKHLAGVGVVFYVMLALRARLRVLGWFAHAGLAEPNMVRFLDLVALGTVADLVPLDHNNRILVQQGLLQIRSGRVRPGIQALLKVAGRQAARVVTSDLGFVLAPRLNAAGRLTDMSVGIECLLASSFNRAYALALQLNQLNSERQIIEQGMQQQALMHLEQLAIGLTEPGICLFDEKWHQGIIGLLASRLKERFHRPVIVFAPGVQGDELKGSARSIPGVHIRDLLATIASCYPNLIKQFGGHAMAAGLSLCRAGYELFRQAFMEKLRHHIDVEQLTYILYSDGELNHEDFTLELAEQLRVAIPWGQGFAEPIFDGYFRVLEQRLISNKHLKMTLALQQPHKLLSAIAFNIDTENWPNDRVDALRVAYRLSSTEYRGRRDLQLIIETFDIAY